MFGLDDQLAQLSDGSRVLVVCAVAILLGLRHASDPDHLAAVTVLVAGGGKRRKRLAARLGLTWGLGHGTALLAFGLPIVLAKAYLPDAAQRAVETTVGVVIGTLAVWLLVRWRRGVFHLHVHDHGSRGRHLHGHAGGGDHPHVSERSLRTPRQAFGIGLLHGVGGSAGVGVILLATIHNRLLAVGALALLALFTAGSMALLSTGVGATLGSARVGRSLHRVVPALGVGSLVFGAWYALGALNVVPYVL